MGSMLHTLASFGVGRHQTPQSCLLGHEGEPGRSAAVVNSEMQGEVEGKRDLEGAREGGREGGSPVGVRQLLVGVGLRYPT